MGLTLQVPVPNRDGSLISSVVDKADKRALLCTVLTWVDGEGLTGQEENVASLGRESGSTIARMHNFASGWNIPVPFIRPGLRQRQVRGACLASCVWRGIRACSAKKPTRPSYRPGRRRRRCFAGLGVEGQWGDPPCRSAYRQPHRQPRHHSPHRLLLLRVRVLPV
jgi:hypothetical protein